MRRWTNCYLLSLLAIALLFSLTISCGTQKESTDSVESRRAAEIFDLEKDVGLLTIRFFYLEGDDRTGDAILIRSPSGKAMLVDAGTVEAAPQLNDHMERLGIKEIDYGVVTHPHHDHIGGYDLLLRTIKFKKLLMIRVLDTTPTYKRVMQTAERKAVPVEYVEEGDEFSLDQWVSLEVLNPPKETGPESLPEELTVYQMNNLSMVLRMKYGVRYFLFTGDIYSQREEELIETKAKALRSDVIKVPHHGESTSSSRAFVEAVGPSYTFITINILQSLPIYKRYRRLGSQVFITGFDGTVLLRCDGKDITVLTERERKADLLD
jgi:beta-lactamase superfamily II metal-dependent hydrolase